MPKSCWLIKSLLRASDLVVHKALTLAKSLIVTVVDAKHVLDRLAETASHEAEDQIAFADVLILNKTDLVSPAELAAVKAQIRRINAYAPIHDTTRCGVAHVVVLDRGAFDLDRILEIEPGARLACVSVIKASRIAIDVMEDE